MSLTEETVAQSTQRTLGASSVTGLLMGSVMRPEDPTSYWGSGGTEQGRASPERDSSVNDKPSKGMTRGLPEPRNRISHNTSHTRGCKGGVGTAQISPA